MGKHTDAIICYGWMDDDYYVIMEYDSMVKLDDLLEAYTTTTNYGMHSDTVYGIHCDFDSKTGVATISDEKKLRVEIAYKKWCDKKGITPNLDEVQFYQVICGDWDPRHETRYYTLDFE